ncbi:hypothetical protein JTE90_012229 [Oedothorax gibbosus]|uniref:Uncharacterized protein n=1 Tax=Oedothorax gibbosus TaxID=931172 RepID=A0AAV6UYR8_9ARAC|nr:hypothetical protein JTE90_012229 [Oedothorax gibbosus]
MSISYWFFLSKPFQVLVEKLKLFPDSWGACVEDADKHLPSHPHLPRGTLEQLGEGAKSSAQSSTLRASSTKLAL